MFDLDALSAADRLFAGLSDQPRPAPVARPERPEAREEIRRCPHLRLVAGSEATS